eukprot:TRINITY_DN3569_c1_g1_i4.p1 TRINITY_DN3569_c1_g1~~TRINITY_DN3569_c1_g1_i4.p1  ORF type:complete len:516 (-),score=137.28 TRINITY_DN3569_c1_g1_i4:166-1713(-)
MSHRRYPPLVRGGISFLLERVAEIQTEDCDRKKPNNCDLQRSSSSSSQIMEEDVLTQFDDTPCGSLASLITRLEGLVDNVEFESDSPEINSLMEVAKRNIQIGLCILIHYQTSGTLKSLWNYFTSKSWDQIIAETNQDLESSVNSLFQIWLNRQLKSQSPPANTSPTITPVTSPQTPRTRLLSPSRATTPTSSTTYGTSNGNSGVILESQLLIDDAVHFATIQGEMILSKSNESVPSWEKQVDISQCLNLIEHISEPFFHSFLIKTSKSSMDVKIPFPSRGFSNPMQQWISAIRILYVRGHVKRMLENPGHETIQEEAVHALQLYPDLPKIDRLDIGKSVLKQIIKSMETFKFNFNLEFWSIGAIHNLTNKIDYNKMIVGSEGGISAILNSMKRFPDEIKIQHEGIKALQNLAFGVEFNKVLIGNFGGIPFVLSAMRKFPGDFELQISSLGCLANLTSTDDANKSAMRNGGVGSIITSMMNHRSNYAVQYYGFGALVNTACNGTFKLKVQDENSS